MSVGSVTILVYLPFKREFAQIDMTILGGNEVEGLTDFRAEGDLEPQNMNCCYAVAIQILTS
jgi:hypothetical protein